MLSALIYGLVIGIVLRTCQRTLNSPTGVPNPRNLQKKQKGLNDRNDMEAQINAMTSEKAHLMDLLAIAKRRKKKREVVLRYRRMWTFGQ